MKNPTPRYGLALGLVWLAGAACASKVGAGEDPTETEASDGDGDPTDGDGEPGDGEPGDGEPGDGEPGDGEPGDGEPGDGDGDPSCEETCEPPSDCLTAFCVGDECEYRTLGPCEELDGIADMYLTMEFVTHAYVPERYAPGTQLRVFGEPFNCGEDDCDGWVVVRAQGQTELLGAMFEKFPAVTDATLASFGETLDSWLAPLTLDTTDRDYCEVVDVPCQRSDDDWYQFATFDLDHGQDGLGRFIHQSVGWAGGGHAVSVSNWQDGTSNCGEPRDGRVVVMRTGCEGDCPAPTTVGACDLPMTPSSEFDKLTPLFNEAANILVSGPYDAACTVLEAPEQALQEGVRVYVALDCTFDVAPTFSG